MADTTDAPADRNRTTFHGVAHPWHCDAMGHMNTRHIVALFDDAGFQLVTALGYGVDPTTPAVLGWADVDLRVEFIEEIRVGAALVVRSSIGRVGSKSFTHLHELRHVASGHLHARATVVTVHYDLGRRSAAPLPPGFSERARAFTATAGA